MVRGNLENARNFSDFDEAASYALQVLSKQAGMNSFYVAKQEGEAQHVVKVHNLKHHLIEEGQVSVLPCTLSALCVEHGAQALIIEHIGEHALTRSLGIADGVETGCFIGVPIFYEDGSVYGTICGIDDGPCELPADLPFIFETLATLLTYVLELEQAYEEIESLAAPLVPIVGKVAILPIIGEVRALRAKTIIDQVMHDCAEKGIEVLIVDVSGVSQINSEVGEYLLKLVKVLELIGVKTAVTGIQPYMALKVPHFAQALKGTMIEANLETALKRLGFSFQQN
ncbi:histidine kinase [Planococcus maritimus]|uniref:STAS domain-containing protein n=1 Tax=Planococcus maritimus TaxID=192421 RepID=UPI00080F1A8E|nr:STAS domain-containing protein [Planococcus maritimus]ANU15972.1 histidine kinase [Planococcus maritimus]